jgi:hypothetical protein
MKSILKKISFLLILLNIVFSAAAQINFIAIDSLLKGVKAKNIFSGTTLEYVFHEFKL